MANINIPSTPIAGATITLEAIVPSSITPGDWVLCFNVRNADGSVRAARRWTLKADGSGLFDEQLAAVAGVAVAPAFVAGMAAVFTHCANHLQAAAAAGKVPL